MNKFLLALSLMFTAAIAHADLTQVVTNDEQEKLLADTYGRTLYVFDVDQGSGGSRCSDACAELWPPYLLTPEEVTKLAAPYGSIVRPSEKPQLTYDGRPVYTYAFDRVAGDDQGDGIGGVWHYIELK